MSAVVDQKIEGLADALKGAKDAAAVSAIIVDLERQILKQNFDARNAGQDEDPIVTVPYEVGGRNTRGLSWKLELLRAVSKANFVVMRRTGVHGGGVNLIGQQKNIDLTLKIYDALAAAYDPLSTAAFTSYSEGRTENDPAVHKVGWMNQFLIETPKQMGQSIDEAFATATSGNSKLAKVVQDKTDELSAYVASQSLASKPAKEPKAPKAKKSAKNGQSTESAPQGEGTETATVTEGDTATDTASATVSVEEGGPEGQ